MSIFYAESGRNAFIDSFKGFLIILVVVGHILPGTLYENPIRYVIYSFHMPAFFFISGYLINVSKIKSTSTKLIIIKYFRRIIIPWVIAVQVYFIVNCIVSNSFSAVAYLKAYIVPYYHLWFCLGYLFCIFVVVAVLKIIQEFQTATRVILTIGIMMAVFYVIRLSWGNTNKVIELIEYTIRPWNMFFFSIGIYKRNIPIQPLRQSRVNCIIALALFVLFLPIGYMFQDFVFEPLIRFFLIGIILFEFKIEEYKINNSIMNFLGRETYPIYLWHILGKAIAINLNEFTYYVITILWVIFLLILLMLIKKNNPIRIIIGR